MPSKVRITTTKKNAEMKKKRYFVRLRTSRLLSRVKRTKHGRCTTSNVWGM